MFKFLSLLIQFSLGERDQPIKAVLIQGCSAAGKSTLSNYLYESIASSDIKVVLIRIDNYYHSSEFELTSENIQKYNFDSPAAIDWYALCDTLNAYSNKDSYVPHHEYDFATQQNSRTMIKNIFPEVIIVEGVLAFNLFNRSMINFPELDPFDSEKKISSDYIQNGLLDMSNFAVDPKLKLLVKITKDKLIKVRLARDKKHRKTEFENSVSESLIEQRIMNQIEKYVWPATEKWTYSPINQPYVEVIGGTFNIKQCEEQTREILHFLGAEKRQTFESYIKELI